MRFGFIGLKPASSLAADQDARVQFTLTHDGNEAIIDRSNAKFTFDHDMISALFSFRLNGAGDMSIVDDGNIGEANINQTSTSYAAPGPFTDWTVDISGTEFDKLDITGVTGAYLDFCGTNYAYA